MKRDICLLGALCLVLGACRDFQAGPADIAEGGSGGSSGSASDGSSASSAQAAGSPSGGGGSAGHAAAPGSAGSAAQNSVGAAGTVGIDNVEPIEPSSLAGLALWLTASKEFCVEGEHHEVVSWADRTAYHNDAKARPGYSPPKFLEITLTGHPTLRFDASPSSLAVPDKDSLHFGDGDFAYLVVARLRNDAQPVYDNMGELVYAGSGSILAKLESSYPFKGIVMWANYPTPAYNAPAFRRLAVQLALSGVLTLSSTDHLNDDVFRVYTVRRTHLSEVQIRINGEPEGHSMISGTLDVSAVASDLLIGGIDKQPFAGDISEIVAVAGALEDRVLLSLEKGLLEKHRL